MIGLEQTWNLLLKYYLYLLMWYSHLRSDWSNLGLKVNHSEQRQKACKLRSANCLSTYMWQPCLFVEIVLTFIKNWLSMSLCKVHSPYATMAFRWTCPIYVHLSYDIFMPLKCLSFHTDSLHVYLYLVSPHRDEKRDVNRKCFSHVIFVIMVRISLLMDWQQ
jgi:hypothetical protein